MIWGWIGKGCCGVLTRIQNDCETARPGMVRDGQNYTIVFNTVVSFIFLIFPISFVISNSMRFHLTVRVWFVLLLLCIWVIDLSDGKLSHDGIHAEIPDNIPGIDEVDPATGYTRLMRAASIGDLESIKNYLKGGASTNIQNHEGNTALMIAAKNGMYHSSLHLINSEADLNIVNKHGMSALLLAVSSGFNFIIMSLVNHGAFIDSATPDGTTALMMAAQRGDFEIVKFLLEKGANINLKNEEKSTALMFAVSSKEAKVVRLLLEHGASVNLQDERGFSALSHAAFRGRGEMAEILIEYGADIEVKDVFDRTPIMIAIEQSQQAVMDALIGNGCKLPKRGWKASSEIMKKRQKILEKMKNEL